MNATTTRNTLLALITLLGMSFTPSASAGLFDALKIKRQAIPLKNVFRSIQRERYSNSNDCSNKAGRYAKALRENGYKADVVVVKMHRRGELHAIVKLDNGMYYDPTFGTSGDKVERFGKYRFTIAYADLGKWGNEFK